MRWLMMTLGLALIAGASAGQVHAQNCPNRTIRMVVCYAPGGGVSVLAQLVGHKLTEVVKQTVVIDNRPGAGGNIGADVVAKSAPDGYTVLLHTSAMASIGPMYRSLPFDPVKDFAPVTNVIGTQLVITGSLKHPAKTLRVLLADANPGKLNYGSKRMTQLPDVPTAAEEGVKGFEDGSWTGLFMPSGTPPEIVQTLQQAMAKVLADPTIRERLHSFGKEPIGNTPAEFAAQFKADIARFASIIEKAKIQKLD